MNIPLSSSLFTTMRYISYSLVWRPIQQVPRHLPTKVFHGKLHELCERDPTRLRVNSLLALLRPQSGLHSCARQRRAWAGKVFPWCTAAFWHQLVEACEGRDREGRVRRGGRNRVGQ